MDKRIQESFLKWMRDYRIVDKDTLAAKSPSRCFLVLLQLRLRLSTLDRIWVQQGHHMRSDCQQLTHGRLDAKQGTLALVKNPSRQGNPSRTKVGFRTAQASTNLTKTVLGFQPEICTFQGRTNHSQLDTNNAQDYGQICKQRCDANGQNFL